MKCQAMDGGLQPAFVGEILMCSGGMPSSPYHNVNPHWRERLKAEMDRRKWSARKVALLADLDAGLVSEWLNPKKMKEPSFASLAAVARALEVPVSLFAGGEEIAPDPARNDIAPSNLSYAMLKGELQAGIWREPRVYAVADDALVPVVPHPDFAGLKQYAWKVVGNSMNLVVKPGGFVIGVSLYDIIPTYSLKDQDVVVCERKDGEKIECTLKRVVKDGDNFRLQAESDDPDFQESFWLSNSEDGEEVTVRATYLVIGAFRFFA